ncbi:MAG: hypothetical protein JSV04_14920 [Candidatus Heimdallarchaeota archaeon]|nr:MAG: hypothetical protein JSV04_14920 [Candidatus Heimdallarchaeota archaeon]
MTIPPKIPKEIVCREYLEQQIYVDPDIIIDRMNTVQFHAPGSGKVIDEMLRIFCSYAEKYQFEDDPAPYIAFIEDLAEELGFESQDAVTHFTRRYNDMKKGRIFDQSIYFMTVLSSIIESFQKKVVSRLSLRLKRKISLKKDISFVSKLEALFQTSNSTFSLMVNIEILKEMGRLIGVEMDPILTDSFEKEIISVLEDM